MTDVIDEIISGIRAEGRGAAGRITREQVNELCRRAGMTPVEYLDLIRRHAGQQRQCKPYPEGMPAWVRHKFGEPRPAGIFLGRGFPKAKT